MCHTYTFYNTCGHVHTRTHIRCLPTIDARIDEIYQNHDSEFEVYECSDIVQEFKLLPFICAECSSINAMSEWMRRSAQDRVPLFHSLDEEFQRASAAIAQSHSNRHVSETFTENMRRQLQDLNDRLAALKTHERKDALSNSDIDICDESEASSDDESFSNNNDQYRDLLFHSSNTVYQLANIALTQAHNRHASETFTEDMQPQRRQLQDLEGRLTALKTCERKDALTSSDINICDESEAISDDESDSDDESFSDDGDQLRDFLFHSSTTAFPVANTALAQTHNQYASETFREHVHGQRHLLQDLEGRLTALRTRAKERGLSMSDTDICCESELSSDDEDYHLHIEE